MTIAVIHRDLFSMQPHIYRLPEGETLAQMARRVRSLPDGWPRHDHDVICINGQPVPQGVWHMVRPKPVAHGVPVEVTFHAPPMAGGDDGGGKSVLGLVASLALTVVSGGIAAGTIFPALSGITIAGNLTLAKVVATAVLVGGSLALSVLAPSPSRPVPQAQDNSVRQLGSASAQGNILEPNAALPRVVGTRKVFPPFVTEPLVTYDGEDETVEVVAALAGPHDLADIRIAGAPIDDLPGVDYETREGWPGLAPLTIVRRHGRTVQINGELRGHSVSDDDGTQLQSQTDDIADATPLARILATRNGQDEFRIGINFPQGLFRQADDDDPMRVPIRMRIRPYGTSTWTNLPEIHFQAAHVGEKRATIKLRWRDGEVPSSSAATTGWVEARLTSAGQSIAPTTDGWTAAAYFDADTGGAEYVTNSNLNSNDVINCILSADTAEFSLDTATFPRGRYEVEIKRGYAFRNAQYSASAYTLNGTVRDFFWYQGSNAVIYQTKDGLADKMYIVRTNSIWNEPPVQAGDVALIAVRARNVNIDQLSTLASGYVRDWDGSGWTDWKTTSNPAPHLRDILAGLMSAEPVDPAIIDDDSLTTWRAEGWECNAIIDDQSVTEAARIVAGSGYGRLYQSEVWGVVRDYDRSAEDPVQTFTPHNSASFNWSKAFPRLPDGFRATFADEDDDYDPRQIIHPPEAVRTEQVVIDGITTEAGVRARLDYDLKVLRNRMAFYSWDAPAEAIKCRRGSLVGVANDVLSTQYGSGRVADWDLDSSGDITAIYLDNEPPVLTADTFSEITDLSAVDDMSLIGARSGVVLRRSNGTTTTHEIADTSADGRLDLVTAADATGLDEGNLAAVGPLGQETRRLVVLEMQPRTGLTWTLTAVADASAEIFG